MTSHLAAIANPWIAWVWLATGIWYDLPANVYLPSRIRFGNGKRIGVPFRPGSARVVGEVVGRDDHPTDLAGGRKPEVEQVEPERGEDRGMNDPLEVSRKVIDGPPAVVGRFDSISHVGTLRSAFGILGRPGRSSTLIRPGSALGLQTASGWS